MNNYQQAAKIIKESRFSEDIITIDAIALIIERYVDELAVRPRVAVRRKGTRTKRIEEINNDPEYFFKDNHRFWQKLDKAALEAERKQAA